MIDTGWPEILGEQDGPVPHGVGDDLPSSPGDEVVGDVLQEAIDRIGRDLVGAHVRHEQLVVTSFEAELEG